MSLNLWSTAFGHGEAIPSRYTCEGDNLSPPLKWSGAPHETRSFVLIVDDPDAPDPSAPRATWVHWIVYDIPASTHGLEEGSAELPGQSRSGLNDWRRTGYGGPCPPIGRHRYFHKLFALDIELGDLASPSKEKLLSAMEGHVLGEAVLVGTYEKHMI